MVLNGVEYPGANGNDHHSAIQYFVGMDDLSVSCACRSRKNRDRIFPDDHVGDCRADSNRPPGESQADLLSEGISSSYTALWSMGGSLVSRVQTAPLVADFYRIFKIALFNAFRLVGSNTKMLHLPVPAHFRCQARHIQKSRIFSVGLRIGGTPTPSSDRVLQLLELLHSDKTCKFRFDLVNFTAGGW